MGIDHRDRRSRTGARPGQDIVHQPGELVALHEYARRDCRSRPCHQRVVQDVRCAAFHLQAHGLT